MKFVEKIFDKIKIPGVAVVVLLIVFAYIGALSLCTITQRQRYDREANYQRAIERTPETIVKISSMLKTMDGDLALKYARVQNEFRIVGEAIESGASKDKVAKMYAKASVHYYDTMQEEVDAEIKQKFSIEFRKALQDVKPIRGVKK